MKNVKLTADLLIGDKHHAAGSAVRVTDEHAARLIKSGHAEAAGDDAMVANPDVSPLADVITPEPAGGTIINPVDALAPNVEDNPGLKKLAEIAGPSLKVKSSKVKADDVVKVGPGDEPDDVKPHTTANEITPKAE